MLCSLLGDEMEKGLIPADEKLSGDLIRKGMLSECPGILRNRPRPLCQKLNLVLTMMDIRKGNFRWTVVALLFVATTINYLDRQVIGLLKPTLEKEFSWSEQDYSRIVMAFSTAYALGFLLIGGWIDRVGTKKGYFFSVFFWSLAAVGHALARTTFGFGVARAFLGLSEAGNFPAAIKVSQNGFQKRKGHSQRAYSIQVRT